MQPNITCRPSSRARRAMAKAGVSPPAFISLMFKPRTPAAASRSTSARLCNDSSATSGMGVVACSSPISSICSLGNGCSTISRS